MLFRAQQYAVAIKNGGCTAGFQGIDADQLIFAARFQDRNLPIVMSNEEMVTGQGKTAIQLTAAIVVNFLRIKDIPGGRINGAELLTSIDGVQYVVNDDGGGIVTISGRLVFPKHFRRYGIAFDGVGQLKGRQV